MSVSFEPNLKRRFHRVTVPLFIQVGEVTYKATDWSVDGFRIDQFKGDLQPPAEFQATVLLPYSEFSVQLPVRARVVRREQDTVGCAFIDLTTGQQAALHHLVDAALEGRLGDLGETLYALRAPMPPAERKLVQDTETTEMQVWRMRLLPKALLVVGSTTALILLLVGTLLYLSSRVRIPDGVVLGTVVNVAPQTPGQLTRVHVTEGQRVEVGVVLAETENRELRNAHALAEMKLKTAQAELQAARALWEEEKARADLYAGVIPFQIAQTEAAVRQTDARLKSVRSDLERSARLISDQIGSQSDHDRLLSEHEALLAEREDRLRYLDIMRLNLESVKRGLFFDGREIHGRLKEFEELLGVREAAVAQAREEAAGAAARLEDLSLRAPVAGTVGAVLRVTGETVGPQTPVVSINAGVSHYALGNLHADEAVKIKPGMPVKVLIPTLGLRLDGQVSHIGQELLSGATPNTAGARAPTETVPVRVALPDAPGDLPPGIRAVLLIRVSPWLKAWTY